MRIITLSEPDCGGKPTGYCAVAESEGNIELAAHIKSALMDVWHYGKGMADNAVSGYVMRGLKERGFAWIDERILVELNHVDKFDDENGKKINAEMFVIGLNNGTIKIDVERAPVGVDRKWAEDVVRDALKFYMM